MRLLKLKDVENKTGLKKSTIYYKIQKGTFPQPVKPAASASVWPEHEVDRVIMAWVAGASEEEIKKLVERIHIQRKNLKRIVYEPEPEEPVVVGN